jgi:hypothetical protein
MKQFESLFVDLDNNLRRLGISTYGLFDTTLEEVYKIFSLFSVFRYRWIQITDPLIRIWIRKKYPDPYYFIKDSKKFEKKVNILSITLMIYYYFITYVFFPMSTKMYR